jgi:hypothetical protein
MRKALWVVAVVIGLMAICPALQAADEGPLSQKGTKQFGINMGYGYSFITERDMRFVDVYPYFGYVFTNPIGKGWYRGTGECIIEGAFSYIYKKQKTYKAGINLMGRYNLLAHSENWRPYVQVGVGFIGTNLVMEGFSSNFNFMPNVGSGIQYIWESCNAVNFEWRYEHLSNGGIEMPNSGIHLNTFLIGYSHTF